MKNSAHLIAGILLALNLSAVMAGGHTGKPGKNSGSASPPQSATPRGEQQRQKAPADSADEQRERDQDRERNTEREWERDRERAPGTGQAQPGQGNERSAEMRQRRDVRKEEKARYKGDRVPGQEGNSNKGAPNDNADEDAKKPWYAFWE